MECAIDLCNSGNVRLHTPEGQYGTGHCQVGIGDRSCRDSTKTSTMDMRPERGIARLRRRKISFLATQNERLPLQGQRW